MAGHSRMAPPACPSETPASLQGRSRLASCVARRRLQPRSAPQRHLSNRRGGRTPAAAADSTPPAGVRNPRLEPRRRSRGVNFTPRAAAPPPAASRGVNFPPRAPDAQQQRELHPHASSPSSRSTSSAPSPPTRSLSARRRSAISWWRVALRPAEDSAPSSAASLSGAASATAAGSSDARSASSRPLACVLIVCCVLRVACRVLCCGHLCAVCATVGVGDIKQ